MMGRFSKIGLALAIVGSGMGLAMLFPQRGTEVQIAEPSSQRGLVLRDPASTTDVPVRSFAWPLRPEAGTPPTSAPQTEAPAEPPPELPPKFRGQWPARPTGLVHRDPPPERHESLRPTIEPDPEPESKPRERIHRIADGDTLARLARRYYDDASRGEVIYEANREVLSSREVLPIGQQLVIPPLPDDPPSVVSPEAP